MSDDEYLLYLRKSVGRMGTGRQRAITTAHLQRRGLRVAADGEFTDTDSTAYARPGEAPPQRKNFARLLAELGRRPGVGIAAWHADRLLRNPEDTEVLIRACMRGGHLIETARGGTYDVTQANGRKRLRDDANDAAYEVDHNRERILEKMAELRGEGRWGGGRRPFGWDVDAGQPGGLVVREDEARLVADATAAIIDGATLTSVAREWEQATGRQWNHVLVRQVLQRPLNVALLSLRGEIAGPGSWPAIVDSRQWHAVRAVLADPARRAGAGPQRRYLLSGTAMCGTCGTGLGIASTDGILVYRCRRRLARDPRGPHASRTATALDEFISALAVARLQRDDAAALLRPDHCAAREALLSEANTIAARRKEQWQLYKGKVITAWEVADGRRQLDAEQAAVDAQLAALDQADALAPMLGDPAAAWERATLGQRRAAVTALMYVTVFPARPGRPKGTRRGKPYFDFESIDVRWVRALPSDTV